MTHVARHANGSLSPDAPATTIRAMSVRPGPRNRNFSPIKDALTRVVRGLDLEKRLEEYAVEPIWERALGPEITRHSRPVMVRHGVLLVETRTATWMNELSLRRKEVLRAVNRELGRDAVHSIRFRVGTGFNLAPGRAAPKEPPPPPPPTDDEISQAVEELGVDTDPEIARIVARALALSRKRHEPGHGT